MKSTQARWHFKIAGSMAFKEGMQKGNPVLLEPMMKVEVLIPEEYLGDIIGQLNARRGEILGMEMRPGNAQAVRAMVPLARCSAMPPSSAQRPKGEGFLRWNLTITPRFLIKWPGKLSDRAVAKDSLKSDSIVTN